MASRKGRKNKLTRAIENIAKDFTTDAPVFARHLTLGRDADISPDGEVLLTADAMLFVAEQIASTATCPKARQRAKAFVDNIKSAS